MTRLRAGNVDAAALVAIVLLSGMGWGGSSASRPGWAAPQSFVEEPGLTPAGRIVLLAMESGYFLGAAAADTIGDFGRLLGAGSLGADWLSDLTPALPPSFCDCDKL
jgi:hypothetical protein